MENTTTSPQSFKRRHQSASPFVTPPTKALTLGPTPPLEGVEDRGPQREPCRAASSPCIHRPVSPPPHTPIKAVPPSNSGLPSAAASAHPCLQPAAASPLTIAEALELSRRPRSSPAPEQMPVPLPPVPAPAALGLGAQLDPMGFRRPSAAAVLLAAPSTPWKELPAVQPFVRRGRNGQRMLAALSSITSSQAQPAAEVGPQHGSSQVAHLPADPGVASPTPGKHRSNPSKHQSLASSGGCGSDPDTAETAETALNTLRALRRHRERMHQLASPQHCTNTLAAAGSPSSPSPPGRLHSSLIQSLPVGGAGPRSSSSHAKHAGMPNGCRGSGSALSRQPTCLRSAPPSLTWCCFLC